MKTIFKHIAASAIALSTIVCGAGGLTPTSQAQTKWTEESLLKLVKTPKGQTIKLDEYKAVFLKYADMEIDDELDIAWNTPVSKALDKISSDYKLPDLKNFYLSLLTSESAQVKGKAIVKLDTWRLEDDVVNKITDAIKNDTSAFVIACGLRSIGFQFNKYEDLADFMRGLENHPNDKLRADLAHALTSYGNKDSESAKAMLHRLIKDKYRGVRKAVATSIGTFHDESFIDDLEYVLNDPADQFLHSEAFKSLFNLWYDISSTSKRAHDICFDYLNKKPRTDKAPAWLAVSYLRFEKPEKYGFGRKEWKEKATYFSETAWVNLLIDIVTDKQADSYARSNAVEKIAILGTKADLETTKAKVEALTDDDEREDLISKIDRELNR